MIIVSIKLIMKSRLCHLVSENFHVKNYCIHTFWNYNRAKLLNILRVLTFSRVVFFISGSRFLLQFRTFAEICLVTAPNPGFEARRLLVSQWSCIVQLFTAASARCTCVMCSCILQGVQIVALCLLEINSPHNTILYIHTYLYDRFVWSICIVTRLRFNS